MEALKGKQTTSAQHHQIEAQKDGTILLRYARPVPLKDRCLVCHNQRNRYDPDYYERRGVAPRTDWEVGETRGVLEIQRPMMIAKPVG